MLVDVDTELPPGPPIDELELIYIDDIPDPAPMEHERGNRMSAEEPRRPWGACRMHA